MPIRVLIVDDHHVIRDGLRSLLAGADIEICGEIERGAEVLSAVAATSPDLVVLDIRIGDDDGLAILAELRRREPPVNVLIFTAHDNPLVEARAFQTGANGFLQKDVLRADLLAAVRETATGKSLWKPSDQRRLNAFFKLAAGVAANHPPLTPREREILGTIVDGLTNKQIGERFGISAETVKEHVQHLFRKIGVCDRTQAAVWAVRQGIC